MKIFIMAILSLLAAGDLLAQPREFLDHYAAMPNSVDRLEVLIRAPERGARWHWERVEAWGQLCFDDAAANAAAYHLYNGKPNHGKGWLFCRWRVEMSGPLVGGAKRFGHAPKDFKISNYVGR